MPVAKRDDWRTLPLPERRKSLAFHESYDTSASERMKRGLVPEEMEDKWFVFFEEEWLYFYHSWTKFCVYAIRFEDHGAGSRVIDSWINAEPAQHRARDLEYERRFLAYLIDALLLGKPTIFPFPAGDFDRDLFQFSTVGRVDAHDQAPSPRWSPWSRFKRWLFGRR